MCDKSERSLAGQDSLTHAAADTPFEAPALSPKPAGEEAFEAQPGSRKVADGGLGKTVGRGMSWMLLATVSSKAVTTITQGVLGWLLLPEHFGRFAVATSVAGLLMLCKDGGVPNFLAKRGSEEYRTLAGPAVWVCFLYNAAAALVMSLAAWPIATMIYDDPKLASMLWVMALALPLGTPAALLQAKLRIDLRFREFGLLMALSVIVRQVTTVIFAMMGFEELSLSLPVPVTAVFDSVMARIICGENPWKFAADIRRWWEIFSHTRWLVIASVAGFLSDWGPYPILGYALDKEATGYYFFAYMITAQVGTLLAHNLHIVLMPVLAKMTADPPRLRDAILRSCRGLMLAASFMCMGVAAVMPGLEDLIWRGRWVPAVVLVIIFGIFYPWRVTSSISSAGLMAQGMFKRYSMLSWGEGLVLVAAAMLGAWVQPTVLNVALWIGGAVMLKRMIGMAVLFYTTGIPITRIFSSMVPGWLVAVAAGGFGIVADLYTPLGQWIPQILPGSWGEGLVTTVVDLARCTLSGGVYCLAFGLLARLMLAGDIREALSMMPGRVRGPVTRLLRL